jgi:hypothetical protein
MVWQHAPEAILRLAECRTCDAGARERGSESEGSSCPCSYKKAVSFCARLLDSNSSQIRRSFASVLTFFSGHSSPFDECGQVRVHLIFRGFAAIDPSKQFPYTADGTFALERCCRPARREIARSKFKNVWLAAPR